MSTGRPEAGMHARSCEIEVGLRAEGGASGLVGSRASRLAAAMVARWRTEVLEVAVGELVRADLFHGADVLAQPVLLRVRLGARVRVGVRVGVRSSTRPLIDHLPGS